VAVRGESASFGSLKGCGPEKTIPTSATPFLDAFWIADDSLGTRVLVALFENQNEKFSRGGASLETFL